MAVQLTHTATRRLVKVGTETHKLQKPILKNLLQVGPGIVSWTINAISVFKSLHGARGSYMVTKRKRN